MFGFHTFPIDEIVKLHFFEAVMMVITSAAFYFFVIIAIAICINRQIGLQLFLLAIFSLYFSHFIEHLHVLERSIDTTVVLLPFIIADLLVLSVFFFYLIPTVSNSFFKISSLLVITLTGILFINDFAYATYDVISTIIIGLFIVFTTYRSFDWIGAIPEQLKLMLIFFIPACLLLLSFENSFLVGVLFAVLFGMHLEQLKIGSKIKTTVAKKLLALFIGLSGYFIIQLLFRHFDETLFLLLIHGMMIGFWLAYFLPLLLVKVRVYDRFHPSSKH